MLFKYGYHPAFAYAKSLIRPSSDSLQRNEILAVARALVLISSDAGWDVIWPAMEQDTDFGRELIERLADADGPNAVVVGKRLSESHLGSLYVWLVREFPNASNPKIAVSHRIGIQEEIADFRDSILSQLVERGNRQALAELQAITQELPHRDFTVEAGRLNELIRTNTWIAPRPEEILQMARDPRTAFVESREQLRDMVIESLQELQRLLMSQHLAVFDLWNVVSWGQVRHMADSIVDAEATGPSSESGLSQETWKSVDWRKVGRQKYFLPKDEEHLSDYVARFLCQQFETRAIVINREVRVRRERTDIHIDSFTQAANGIACNQITTVIEVKGCWNNGVSTAMRSQLAGSYLAALGKNSSSGVYLIGVFDCPNWFPHDSRRAKCRGFDIADAQSRYDLQAEELAREGFCISAFVLDARLP